MKTKKRGKILFSILILLIAIGLIPLIVSDWILIEINREDLQTKEKEMQQNISFSIAQMMSLYLETLKEEARNIALELRADFASPRGFSSLRPAAQQPILEGYLQRYPDIRKIAIIDTERRGTHMGYSY